MRKLIPMLLLCALAVGMAGCDGGFALGGQIITVRVYQNAPELAEAPTPGDAPGADKKAGNYSNIDIDVTDGGTSFMGPAANPIATTRPSQK